LHEGGRTGRVFAVDLSTRFVAVLAQRIGAERLGNAVAVLCDESSVRLQPGSITQAFVCDTFQHFERPPAMLASIHVALVPGGGLVVVDFDRIPGVSRGGCPSTCGRAKRRLAARSRRQRSSASPT